MIPRFLCSPDPSFVSSLERLRRRRACGDAGYVVYQDEWHKCPHCPERAEVEE